MADETKPEMGAVAEATPAAQPETGDLRAELERVRIALAEANKEAATRRKKLEAYEKAEAERKQAEMTEIERAQAAVKEMQQRVEAAQQERNGVILRSAIIAEASRLGFLDPQDAQRMLDADAVTIEAGQVQGVEAALKTLAEAKPYLLRQDPSKGPAFTPTNPGQGGATTGETNAARRLRLFGGGADALRANGAGVIPVKQ